MTNAELASLSQSIARTAILCVSNPLSDSAVGTLAARYANVLIKSGWAVSMIAPFGTVHSEAEAFVELLDRNGLYSRLEQHSDSGDPILMLGLPREQEAAQQSIRFMSGTPTGAILWERPGKSYPAIADDLIDAEEIPNMWTLNDIYVDRLRRSFPKTNVAIAPLIVPDQFFAARKVPRTQTKDYAVYLARFTAKKGAPRLAQTWCDEVYSQTKLPLLMIGLGLEAGRPDEQAVVALAKAHPDRLQLGYETEAAARVDRLVNAKLAIFPATDDHLPQSLIEAMAVGTPTICSDVEGHALVAKNRISSLTVDPSLSDLRSAVIELIENPDICKMLADNAEQVVMRRFSEATAAAQLSNLFASLVAI